MAYSQMMQHYFSVKEKYKDCIIFYRLGDFYEMFFDDAVKVSKLLGLTLTGRDCGMKERAPMCGVPYHAADQYIAKLVSFGEKVAVCEQLTDPATSKGMVDRGVVRVITAGTITSDSALNEKANNYICGVCKQDENIAVVWADITTGEFCATEFYGGECLGKAVQHMVKLGVKEIICNEEMLLNSKNLAEIKTGLLPSFSSYPEWAFGYKAAERRICEQFSLSSIDSCAIADKKTSVCAAGALLEYLKDTQMHALKNINGVKFISTEKYMQLDAAAVKNLEIVKSLSGNKYGSLLWLLDKTSTAMGARLLSSSLIYPFYDKAEIDKRLDGVEELFNATVVRVNLKEQLKEIKDIERITGKISNGNILPKDCLNLSRSLAAIPNLKFALSGFSSEILNEISSALTDVSDITNLLDSAIEDNDTPSNLKDGGYIKAGFNKELDELRGIKTNAGRMLTNLEMRERDATGIRTLKIGYNRVFGYYIEVSKSFKDKVPLTYQRKQTLANGERYSTDELKKLEEQIVTSESNAIEIESRIYSEIKAKLTENIERFKKISAAVAGLDMLISFAEVAKENRYVRPQIVSSDKPLKITEGRHPVVEVISKDPFMPNDVLLDEKDNRTMIITGPNMAGKSTYMRQTALIAIMAHLGSFVPAKSAQIPLIDRVFTRVGASDNLISDQSTFMVEMIEVATILRNATKNSLLILDEVGRGTSTYDGLSIACAVIEYLTKNVGAKTMFATHYHELTELESRMDGIKNYKTVVKEINGNIVFLRKVMRGGANKSFGIEVASLAGVPAAVTERAKVILKAVEKGEISITDNIEGENYEKQRELSEVETILAETDLNNLSPMQAFMLVSDLVEKVKNGKN